MKAIILTSSSSKREKSEAKKINDSWRTQKKALFLTFRKNFSLINFIYFLARNNKKKQQVGSFLLTEKQDRCYVRQK